MNKLQVCVSAEATLQKVDECVQGHDKKVKQWIASQVEYLNSVYMYMYINFVQELRTCTLILYKNYDSD